MTFYVLAMGKQHLGPHVVVGYGIKMFWPGLFITSPDHLAVEIHKLSRWTRPLVCARVLPQPLMSQSTLLARPTCTAALSCSHRFIAMNNGKQKFRCKSNIKQIGFTSLTQAAKWDRPTRAPEPAFAGFFPLQNCPPFLVWTLLAIAFHFNSGGSPSTTNTSFTPSRVKWSKRKNRFLRWGLLTFCLRPFAHCASQTHPLKSTQSVLLLRADRFSFLLTGSRILHRWFTPIWNLYAAAMKSTIFHIQPPAILPWMH